MLMGQTLEGENGKKIISQERIEEEKKIILSLIILYQ